MMISLPIVNSSPADIDLKFRPIEIGLPAQPVVENRFRFPSYRLRELLVSSINLPLRTALLGLDQQENPLLFDLMDPRPGSILVCADRDAGKLKLLKTLLHSLVFANRPYEVQFSIISARTNQWRYEQSQAANYISHLTNNFDRSAGQTILDLCDLAESRQHGRNEGACRVLILDGFDTIPYMDFDVRINLEWLLQEGPYVEIWPVIVMDSRTALEQKKWTDLFKTRIVGNIKDRNAGIALSRLENLTSDRLEMGSEFVVRIGNREHHFFLPEAF